MSIMTRPDERAAKTSTSSAALLSRTGGAAPAQDRSSSCNKAREYEQSGAAILSPPYPSKFVFEELPIPSGQGLVAASIDSICSPSSSRISNKADQDARLAAHAATCAKRNWQVVLFDEPKHCYSFLFRNYLNADRSEFYYAEILNHAPWEDIMSGRDQKKLSRKTAWWVTDPNCTCAYTYGTATRVESKKEDKKQKFAGLMRQLWRELKFDQMTVVPNSVNLNLYEDGSQGVGWHADNESLFDGTNQDARILSLSLGGSREFWLADLEGVEDEDYFSKVDRNSIVETTLHQGDLITMEGMMQKYTQHYVPYAHHRRRETKPRINLTFRDLVVHKKSCALSKVSAGSTGAIPTKDVASRKADIFGEKVLEVGAMNSRPSRTSFLGPYRYQWYEEPRYHDVVEKKNATKIITTRWTACTLCSDNPHLKGRRCLPVVSTRQRRDNYGSASSSHSSRSGAVGQRAGTTVDYLCRNCCEQRFPKSGIASRGCHGDNESATTSRSFTSATNRPQVAGGLSQSDNTKTPNNHAPDEESSTDNPSRTAASMLSLGEFLNLQAGGSSSSSSCSRSSSTSSPRPFCLTTSSSKREVVHTYDPNSRSPPRRLKPAHLRRRDKKRDNFCAGGDAAQSTSAGGNREKEDKNNSWKDDWSSQKWQYDRGTTGSTKNDGKRWYKDRQTGEWKQYVDSSYSEVDQDQPWSEDKKSLLRETSDKTRTVVEQMKRLPTEVVDGKSKTGGALSPDAARLGAQLPVVSSEREHRGSSPPPPADDNKSKILPAQKMNANPSPTYNTTLLDEVDDLLVARAAAKAARLVEEAHRVDVTAVGKDGTDDAEHGTTEVLVVQNKGTAPIEAEEKRTTCQTRQYPQTAGRAAQAGDDCSSDRRPVDHSNKPDDESAVLPSEHDKNYTKARRAGPDDDEAGDNGRKGGWWSTKKYEDDEKYHADASSRTCKATSKTSNDIRTSKTHDNCDADHTTCVEKDVVDGGVDGDFDTQKTDEKQKKTSSKTSWWQWSGYNNDDAKNKASPNKWTSSTTSWKNYRNEESFYGSDKRDDTDRSRHNYKDHHEDERACYSYEAANVGEERQRTTTSGKKEESERQADHKSKSWSSSAVWRDHDKARDEDDPTKKSWWRVDSKSKYWWWSASDDGFDEGGKQYEEWQHKKDQYDKKWKHDQGYECDSDSWAGTDQGQGGDGMLEEHRSRHDNSSSKNTSRNKSAQTKSYHNDHASASQKDGEKDNWKNYSCNSSADDLRQSWHKKWKGNNYSGTWSSERSTHEEATTSAYSKKDETNSSAGREYESKNTYKSYKQDEEGHFWNKNWKNYRKDGEGGKSWHHEKQTSRTDHEHDYKGRSAEQGNQRASKEPHRPAEQGGGAVESEVVKRNDKPEQVQKVHRHQVGTFLIEEPATPEKEGSGRSAGSLYSQEPKFSLAMVGTADASSCASDKMNLLTTAPSTKTTSSSSNAAVVKPPNPVVQLGGTLVLEVDDDDVDSTRHEHFSGADADDDRTPLRNQNRKNKIKASAPVVDWTAAWQKTTGGCGGKALAKTAGSRSKADHVQG
ncbi:unnamed protein product [Amoebophrya sp. A120]|nr:unnamed protein product [Amoebophrya sp. A120]|eukprot:GSA120T00021042001.1